MANQDRQAWLRARQKSIGSSDAAVVMGVSPWKNLLQLYVDKTCEEIVEDTTNQYAKDRGNEIEPKIRKLWEKKTGRAYPPISVVMTGAPHLAASLDGRADDNTICEIKWSGFVDWKRSREQGIVPKKYVPQIQHQLMVSGASRCYYLSYPYSKEPEIELDPEKLSSIEVLPDREYQEQLKAAEDAFWFNHVVPRIPPVVAPERAVLEDKSPMWGGAVDSRLALAARRWLLLDKSIKKLQVKQDEYRAIIVEAAAKTEFSKLVCGGIRVSKQTRNGNVDYASIPQLQGVDLEGYRKPPSSYWKLELEK